MVYSYASLVSSCPRSEFSSGSPVQIVIILNAGFIFFISVIIIKVMNYKSILPQRLSNIKSGLQCSKWGKAEAKPQIIKHPWKILVKKRCDSTQNNLQFLQQAIFCLNIENQHNLKICPSMRKSKCICKQRFWVNFRRNPTLQCKVFYFPLLQKILKHWQFSRGQVFATPPRTLQEQHSRNQQRRNWCKSKIWSSG